MATPTLTPRSTTSAVVLPATGAYAEVSGTLPFGMYLAGTGSADFISGAVDQVAYTYKKLGGDILDIELRPGNVYTAYEEAVLEYSYIVNVHQAKNVLSDFLGSTTGAFDHDGALKPEWEGGPSHLSASLSGSHAALKYPRFSFEHSKRVSEAMATEAGVGGNVTEYSASFTPVNGVQDYNLQAILMNSSSSEPVEFADKIKNKKITVKKVFYKTRNSMWRFFGYYGGLNVVGNLSSYGQYADDSTFEVIPSWHNKLQARAFETSIYTRNSHFSYEIKNNDLRIFPTPVTYTAPEKFWIQFTVKLEPWEEDSTRKIGVDGVNNMNTLPFANVPYQSINSIGKQWIRRFALSLAKEMLGQIRGKFATIPIPGESVTLNGSELISQAKDEQDKLREELKTVLDELTYHKLVEKDAGIVDSSNKVNQMVPNLIYMG